VVCVLAAWAAYLQLNDPDPERWFALYAACAAVALASALGRGSAPLAAGVGVVALVWALAIVPELLGRWTPADLGASMSSARPEVEYGRELGGLSIVTAYCAAAWFRERRRTAGDEPRRGLV
jgi:Transmembrane family 220, helix